MIFIRAKGGEDLKAAITRAINVAAQGSDIVELRFNGVEITIHPTWVDTVAQFWTERHNEKLTQANR